MASTLAPLPFSDPIARKRDPKKKPGERDPLELLATDAWQDSLSNLAQVVGSAPVRLGEAVELDNQQASIGATSLPLGTTGRGFYVVHYNVRIMQAASVSSSVTFSVNWTKDGIARTFTGAAVTGNTTGTFQQGQVDIPIDAATPLTYSTVYASVGGTPMQYGLVVTVERIA